MHCCRVRKAFADYVHPTYIGLQFRSKRLDPTDEPTELFIWPPNFFGFLLRDESDYRTSFCHPRPAGNPAISIRIAIKTVPIRYAW